MWRRKRSAPQSIGVHRGRIWHDSTYGHWRYVCLDCDYGASSNGEHLHEVVLPWFTKLASDHADPTHWTRRRPEYQ